MAKLDKAFWKKLLVDGFALLDAKYDWKDPEFRDHVKRQFRRHVDELRELIALNNGRIPKDEHGARLARSLLPSEFLPPTQYVEHPLVRPGTCCLIDGTQLAVVRDYFPEGSTSYHFPHYVVKVDHGEDRVVIAAERVEVLSS